MEVGSIPTVGATINTLPIQRYEWALNKELIMDVWIDLPLGSSPDSFLFSVAHMPGISTGTTL